MTTNRRRPRRGQGWRRAWFALALLPVVALLAALPAAADDGAAPVAPAGRTVTPAGWPLALTFPAYGELKVAGVDGVKTEDIDNSDLSWYTPFNQPGDGMIYYINCDHDNLGVATPSDADWQAMADWYKRRLLQNASLQVLSSDSAAQIGGRRWVRLSVSYKDASDSTEQTYYAFATMASGSVYYVDIYYNSPPGKDAEAQIATILGAATTAPPA
jgi:hypothetical protein